MFIEQVPNFFRRLYPQALWRINPQEKAVYLTFDDGPVPLVTPWVLSQLKHENVRATFFMVGDNVRKYPDIYNMVVEDGHRIGNHTYHHLSGARHSTKEYLQDANLANELLRTSLFRPPHGWMRWEQYLTLRHHYKIVMWDVITRDYSKQLRGPQVLANVMKYARRGSIITFHDSLKSWNNGNLQYALPAAIRFLKSQGYEFKTIP